jgi:hypothetical protein
MRLSNRYWTVLAGGLAGGLTTLVIVLPSVHFAYRSATLHATIETAAALVTLLAAYLALSRFRGTGRSDDLALTTALGLLACASFAFSALPWALLSGGPVRFSAWMSLIGTAAGAGVLCLAALAPGHALSGPRETARKTWHSSSPRIWSPASSCRCSRAGCRSESIQPRHLRATSTSRAPRSCF